MDRQTEREERKLREMADGYKPNPTFDELARRDHQTLSASQRIALGHYLQAKDAHRQLAESGGTNGSAAAN